MLPSLAGTPTAHVGEKFSKNIVRVETGTAIGATAKAPARPAAPAGIFVAIARLFLAIGADLAIVKSFPRGWIAQ